MSVLGSQLWRPSNNKAYFATHQNDLTGQMSFEIFFLPYDPILTKIEKKKKQSPPISKIERYITFFQSQKLWSRNVQERYFPQNLVCSYQVFIT